MKRDELEREVLRLAPWYYAWDLDGVLTETTPQFDEEGHRRVFCPPIFDGFWTGKSVLDVACNEGAYGMGALAHGAESLVGFDCRDVNVEKARLVARVLGHERASFDVSDCDRWLVDHPDASFDVVMMCGILYHLTDPLGTIRDYCARAREWVYVTCCVAGSEVIGFSNSTETENIAASLGALDSLMPNNGDTLIEAFQANGFEPAHFEETRRSDFFDGANLLLRKHTGNWERTDEVETGPDQSIYLAFDEPAGGFANLHVAIYNRYPTPRKLRAELLRVEGADLDTLGSEDLDLPARAMTPHFGTSASVHRMVSLPCSPGQPTSAAIRLFDGERLLGDARVTIRG